MYEIKPDLKILKEIFKDHLDKPIWICWKEIPPSEAEIEKAKTLMREAKPVKMPINPNDGSQAKTNDETTWGTFWEAMAYYLDHPDSLAGLGLNYYGKGIHNTNLLPLDLDSIKDEAGNIKPAAQKIILGMNSYTEITPSGKGCRVYLKGNWLKGGRKAGNLILKNNLEEELDRQSIEFFGEGNHYVTVSGVPLEGFDLPLEIRENQSDSKNLFNLIFPPKPRKEIVKEKDVEVTENFLAEELDSAGQLYQQEFTIDQEKNPGTKFKVVCPWGSEEETAHASGINNLGDAFIFVPEDHRRPWFHCSHATCKDKYSWEDYCKKVFGYVLASGSLNKDIIAWINDHPGETFSNRLIDYEFHIYTDADRNNRRQIIARLKKDNKIESLDRGEEYRVITTRIGKMEFKKFDRQDFPIKMPLNINNLGTFKPERIILMQGEVGAGKSAFAFSLIPLNFGIKPIIFLSNSEIDEDDIAERLEWIISPKRPLEYWQNEKWLSFGHLNIETEFADIIKQYRDSILIFDYFDGSKDYTRSAYQMARIHDNLIGTGNIAVVNVQINPNKEVKDNFDLRGYGGQGLTHRPSTVFNLVKGEGHHLIYVQKFKQFNRKTYDYFFDTRYFRKYRVANDKGFVKELEDEKYWIHDDDTHYKLMDDSNEHSDPQHQIETRKPENERKEK